MYIHEHVNVRQQRKKPLRCCLRTWYSTSTFCIFCRTPLLSTTRMQAADTERRLGQRSDTCTSRLDTIRETVRREMHSKTDGSLTQQRQIQALTTTAAAADGPGGEGTTPIFRYQVRKERSYFSSKVSCVGVSVRSVKAPCSPPFSRLHVMLLVVLLQSRAAVFFSCAAGTASKYLLILLLLLFCCWVLYSSTY